MHVLAAISEFERARIAERVSAGLARAKKQGKKLGRPEKTVSEALLAFACAQITYAINDRSNSPWVSHRLWR